MQSIHKHFCGVLHELAVFQGLHNFPAQVIQHVIALIPHTKEVCALSQTPVSIIVWKTTVLKLLCVEFKVEVFYSMGKLLGREQS